MITEVLSFEECGAVLTANHTASLACVSEGAPYVVPISYAFSGGFIYSFSLEGQKIEFMRANPSVSLVVVDHGARGMWKSVIVSGSFEEFTKDRYFDNENDFAWKALSKRADWWDPGSLQPVGQPQAETVNYIYYCVRLEEMTGRSARDEAA